MKNLNRRDLCVALSAFAAMGSVAVSEAHAEGLGGDAGGTLLSTSNVIPYEQLAVIQMPNGGTMRRVMSGVLPTGEFIEIHETMLPAGKMPHPPHKHPNTEVLFIQQGKLEYLDDGKGVPVGPGGIVFSASNLMHGLKNVGDTPASYIVVSVGRQLKD
jgi:mannose-6-phosphate isomerase-like protein (cupin superfamily)